MESLTRALIRASPFPSKAHEKRSASLSSLRLKPFIAGLRRKESIEARKAGDHRFRGEGGNMEAEQRVEQMARHGLVGAEKEDQRNKSAQDEPLEEMASLPVAYLVGQHGEDLIGLHAFEERIEEDDPFRFAHAGKIGVRVPAPLRLRPS